MKRTPRTPALFLLILSLAWLAACSCNDREDRLAKIRGKHGESVLASPATEEVQLSEGARLFREKTCNVCHGDDGIHPLQPDYPILARQGREYALRQMLDIQSGNRSNGYASQMQAVVKDVTEEEFAILADYIANELGDGAPIGGEPDEESPGAMLFKTKTCIACHGKDGKTPILPDYPRIAGLPKAYILRQMHDIKEGARANSMAVKGMQGVMHLVDEQQMEQLADYVSTLPR